TTKDVLLVDDDASIREVIQLTLELVGGWNVHLAASGTEALAQVQEHRPDAILLDMMMPGMDGATTLSRLRSAVPDQDVPVILLSAKLQQRRDDDRLRGLGVAGVIGKPFDPIALPGQIRSILGWAG
ncbi:MAG TPA: response regulator, partial [Microlunatus sp.]